MFTELFKVFNTLKVSEYQVFISIFIQRIKQTVGLQNVKFVILKKNQYFEAIQKSVYN